MKITPIILSLVFLCAFLGGCTTLSSSSLKCMKVVLAPSVSKVRLSPAVKGDTRTVSISNFKGGCGGPSEEIPGEKGDIGIIMELTAPQAKHPMHGRAKVAFPVFVALLDKEDNVLDRYDERIEAVISAHPLNHAHDIIYHPPEGIPVDGEGYKVVVGFHGPVMPVHFPALPAFCAKKKPAPKKIHKAKRKCKKKGIIKKATKTCKKHKKTKKAKTRKRRRF